MTAYAPAGDAAAKSWAEDETQPDTADVAAAKSLAEDETQPHTLDVAAAKLSAEDETRPHTADIAAAKSSAEDVVDHEPTCGLPPGKTSFDKDSYPEDSMGRVC
jgi:hypothetical protein